MTKRREIADGMKTRIAPLLASVQARLGPLAGMLRPILVPFLAVVSALMIGAIVIAISGRNPLLAYAGLIDGSWGSGRAIAGTLVRMTPYVFGGLAVALAFRAGLFNIGGEGQLLLGTLAGAWVGYQLALPAVIHLPLALLAGVLAGFIWGGIPGFLKSRTGAHEVITTIMLNYLAIGLAGWLLNDNRLMKDPSPTNVIARTPLIAESAHLPALIPGQDAYPSASAAPEIVHWGVVLAVLATIAASFFLWRTVWGFEVRTVGANPSAGRYAGINVPRVITLIMGVSGALAGLGGAIQVTAVNYRAILGFNVGYGFDAIAIALLGKNNPFGVLLAALLFASLRSGSTRMQSLSGVNADIIAVIQALILIFVAADQLVRWLYRIRARGLEERTTLTRGWGR
ncbi:MAG: ABC transporter permease [Herpetosiphonaceae bacterium]|nr:MAG: ABC transporter permease [Herpetosiphonaceae bacterium]